MRNGIVGEIRPISSSIAYNDVKDYLGDVRHIHDSSPHWQYKLESQLQARNSQKKRPVCHYTKKITESLSFQPSRLTILCRSYLSTFE